MDVETLAKELHEAFAAELKAAQRERATSDHHPAGSWSNLPELTKRFYRATAARALELLTKEPAR